MPPEPQSLQERFSQASSSSDHISTWNSCWKESYTPWDRQGPSLALADLLSARENLIPPPQQDLSSPISSSSHNNSTNSPRIPAGKAPKKTALVPGCGRGHDVLVLAAHGYDVWGLDVSAEGTKMAKKNEEAERAKEGSLFGQGCVVDGFERGDVNWITGDFFKNDWARGIGTEESGKFDLIFDYTFLCALPPEARPAWAKRMSQLVTPKGRLVCLEFPSGKSLAEKGPPWGLFPEVYEALLAAPGEDVAYDEKGNVLPSPSVKPVQGEIHRLSLIKPERTHPAGTLSDGSGTVTDFISVWSP